MFIFANLARFRKIKSRKIYFEIPIRKNRKNEHLFLCQYATGKRQRTRPTHPLTSN